MSGIEVRNLSKKFGDTVVFHDFSAVFPEGKTTCVMGSSGCGKTTLLHMMMGLESPDAGEILGVPRDISAVFQEDRLFDTFYPLANLRAVLGKSAPEMILRSHLEEIGLDGESLKKTVSELSGGMKRRVAIVRAVLAKSNALFLDEPFRGLDSATRECVIGYVKPRITGKTVVFVTHDPAEAELMGNVPVIRIDGFK